MAGAVCGLAENNTLLSELANSMFRELLNTRGEWMRF
jgi:hypothetical protein